MFVRVRDGYEVGAGEGNRTLASGLGSPRSTIEPHPHPAGKLHTIAAAVLQALLSASRPLLGLQQITPWQVMRSLAAEYAPEA